MAKFDVTSWLLFLAVLINQAGRVMVPAIKTSVLADPKMGTEFQSKVGALLSAVSLVCLGGKLLGAAFTDRLGGWVVLIAVFGIWIAATIAAFVTPSVDIFGYAWLLNSFAYTITWGAAVQVVGAVYNDAERPAELSKCASASRFGATLGNIFFGQLLTAGFSWREVMMPMVPVQVLLLLFCAYKWSTDSKAASAKAAAQADKKKEPVKQAGGTSILSAMFMLDFWLMLIPKAVLFTYTQFFMNYIPQLLNVSYGYDHGMAATLGGVSQVSCADMPCNPSPHMAASCSNLPVIPLLVLLHRVALWLVSLLLATCSTRASHRRGRCSLPLFCTLHTSCLVPIVPPLFIPLFHHARSYHAPPGYWVCLHIRHVPLLQVQLVFLLLLLCAVVPFVLSLGPDALPKMVVVPLTVIWGLAYALPFYIPPGEFAMQVLRTSGPPTLPLPGTRAVSHCLPLVCLPLHRLPRVPTHARTQIHCTEQAIHDKYPAYAHTRLSLAHLAVAQIGGKSSTALFTNIFDAAGFATSAVWNPWASGIAKSGDFRAILLSQALFGAISMVAMPLCMYRQIATADGAKKVQ